MSDPLVVPVRQPDPDHLLAVLDDEGWAEIVTEDSAGTARTWEQVITRPTRREAAAFRQWGRM